MIEVKTPIDRKRRRLIGAVLLAVAAAPARAVTGEENTAVARAGHAPNIDVRREGESILVAASARVAADRATTWQTLADYDRLAEFIPGMASSRTVSRTGSTVLVEQRAQASFGPFTREFALRLSVEEEPWAALRASAAGGDFRRFDACYQLVEAGGEGTIVEYSARLEPLAGVPPLVGTAVMRSLVRRQFEAMLGEIDRRAKV